MAKNANKLNRKVLQNLRTSTQTNEYILDNLSGLTAFGEIAVKMGTGDTVEEKRKDTSIYTLAADGIVAVRFPSYETVQEMINGGASIYVNNIIDAVGLQDDGKIISGDTSVWGTETTYFNSASTVVDAVKALDTNLNSLSGYVADSDYELAHDDNKVVDSLKQVDGRISGTSVNLTSVKLSGYTEGTDADIAETDTLGQALGKLQAQINAMDKAADALTGHIVTTVAEDDGKVTETKALLTDIVLSGYSKTNDTGAIDDNDTLEVALSKLENNATVNAISNADGSINVTTGLTGTDINVNIKSGEHVLAKDGNAGLYTNIKLSGITPSSDIVKEEYVLCGTDDEILGDHIKIYKDQSLVSITLEDNDNSGNTGQYLKYTYIDASGNTQSTYVDVSLLLTQAEFASGVTADNSGIVHGVVDTASEKDENNNPFLTVGADGFKVDGIKNAIDTKINKLDVTGDTVVAGQYVAAIQEADGIVSVKERANVSEAVLNNYAKGSDATAVAATDTVNQAISKLENQVDAAKAAATTKVVEGTDNDHLTVTSAMSESDSSVTYTIELTDVASESALTELSGSVIDEIARAKSAETAIDGAVGLTKGANDESRTWDAAGDYLTGSTVKADMEILDDIIGIVDNTPDDYDVTFSSANTIAQNISDIKRALDEYKLHVIDNKYIDLTITTGSTGTSIEASAITMDIADSTTGSSALVDSWDAKSYLVHELIDNTDTTTGVSDFNVTKVDADEDNGLGYDFTNLTVDCGTF